MDHRQGTCRSHPGRFLGDGCGEPAERMGSRACGTSVRILSAVYRCEVLHLVSVRKDLEFAAVIVTLESDTVGERAHGSVLVFPVRNDPQMLHKGEKSFISVDAPCCRCDTRDSVLRLDLLFVDNHCAKFPGFLVPLQRVSDNGGDIHLPPKVPGKVTEMGSLFDYRTGTAV